MEDQQDLGQETWQVNDLRSGVAKVYAEAKRRSTLGIRIATLWAVVLLVFGTLDFVGITSVSHPLWEIGAGLGVLLLAALSLSRAPGPLLGAAAAVIVDLVILSYGLAEQLERGNTADHTALAIHAFIAPFAISFILNGYFGSLSIQAFKNGFSPGADWRTRISARMMQVVVFGSCGLALLLGVGSWFGAIMSGFAQTDVMWVTESRFFDEVPVSMAPALGVESAETDGKKPDGVLDITVLKHRSPVNEVEVKFPESATPIDSLEGLDPYARHEVQDAFKFAARTDEAGCMLEGQGRQDRCRDDRCRYWARVFARACLTKSRKTEHFCDGVPEATREGDGMVWAQKMCAGRKFETCREIHYAAQGHCHPPQEVRNPGGAAGAANDDKPDARKSARAK